MENLFDAFKPRPKPASLWKRILRILMTGIASLLPIIGSFWLLSLLFSVLTNVGNKLIKSIGWLIGIFSGSLGEKFLDHFAEFQAIKASSFVLPLVILFIVGFMITKSPWIRAGTFIDAVISRVPLVGFIYTTLKQFVDSVRSLGGNKNRFKGVAYVEYPSKGSRLIGFVTGTYYDEQLKKEVTTIFIPTSPNPMTGFVIVTENEYLTLSDMSLEEASKVILSAGVVPPRAELPTKGQTK